MRAQKGNSLLQNSGHGQSEWGAGEAALAEVDRLAIEMESKWGIGRLRLRIPPDLRRRFDAQAWKLARARQSGDLGDLRLQCARMCAAWRAADRAASATGEPAHDGVWEIRLNNGETLMIVRSDIEVGLVRPSGRLTQVWSLEEIARVIEAQPASTAALKARFKGAIIEAMFSKRPALSDEPGSGGGVPFDDPIPF